MKKRVISILLVLVLAISLVAMPAGAKQSKPDPKDYPFIFVHGLLGYGDESKINSLLPYWGMATGDITEYLEGLGYECYAVDVGPISSAWDRACMLYAELTGTTVDYGIAHSAQKGHDRFGLTFDKPLFEGWGKDKKINLIGHSFGGATIRMFLDILADGCPEEVAAAKAAGVEVSPFFEGGKADWVYSLTAISAPHNGTSFFECCEGSSTCIPAMIFDLGSTIGTGKLSGMYDLRLEHFGIYRNEGETDEEYLSRVMTNCDFLSHNDNAMLDLTIDEALRINDGIEIQENVYYFSITGDTTKSVLGSTCRVPRGTTTEILKPFAERMGSYCCRYTEGGFYIDESWLPNDGLVNVVSALYPRNSSYECLKKDGSVGFVTYDGKSEKNFKPGVWNVLPTVTYDHLGTVGGVMSNTVENTRAMYLDLVDNIVSTYSTGSGSGISGFNNPLIKFFDSSKWHQFIVLLRNFFERFLNVIGQ